MARKSKPLSKTVLKTACAATFLINFEYKMRTIIFLVCIIYSMRDLICDVICCCVWSCGMGNINIYDKIMIETQKKRKYRYPRNFYINLHLTHGLGMEFLAF